MNIALLIGLILLNGFFAMSEIALVTARKNRLSGLAEDDDKGAIRALALAEEPTEFLSTIQIGITAIGILNGIAGEAVFAAPIAQMLEGIGLDRQSSSIGATALVVVSITYLSIVIGELVPKRIAQFNAESIARRISGPISFLAKLSRPFVFLLSFSTDGILRIIGKKDFNSPALTEEDIQAMLTEGSETGVIEQQEHEIVRNVFRLDDRQIGSMMTPRSEIVFLDLNQSFNVNLENLVATNHSRFPVCRAGLHDILGVITAKRLLKQHLNDEPYEKIIEYLLPPVYVPETLTGMKLLEQFRESGVQMVFVVDEYGEIMGLITLQDLLEALTGEFSPHNPEDLWAVYREDGSWLLDGLIPIQELKDRLSLKEVPEEEKGRYHTLSGMMMHLLGKVPQTGDSGEWQGWKLEVVDMDGNRIDKVLATHSMEIKPEK